MGHSPKICLINYSKKKKKLYTTLFKYLMILLLKPWLRPKPCHGLELEMALALACIFQSQSHSKLGQSHGFQAKPGQHITSPTEAATSINLQ
jgi:hypothetical protein